MINAMSPENKIKDLVRIVESNNMSEIRLNANGGNSILLICPPEREHVYIDKLKEMLPIDRYSLIDINEVIIRFVEANKEELDMIFDFLKGSVHQIFKAPKGETTPDLFKLLLSIMQESMFENRIPVLYNSGALYGSGIDNIHLMESELVMKSRIPLIILYPATKDGGQLMFLDTKIPSDYRCLIIE